MLLISACHGLVFDEAVAVEHGRWLVVMPLAVCFRFPLFVLWFVRHTEALFLKKRVFGVCLIFLFSGRPVSKLKETVETQSGFLLSSLCLFWGWSWFLVGLLSPYAKALAF